MDKLQRPLIKICGNTSQNDIELAAQAGADFVGIVVDFPPSPRHVALRDAAEIRPSLPLIAVTVNLSVEHLLEIHAALHPYALQLHGDESSATIAKLTSADIRVWKAISGDNALQKAHAALAAGAEAVLVDSRARQGEKTIYGGTGLRSDWDLAQELVRQNHRVILAGGLNAENVTEAASAVHPWVVDAVSGVEQSPGIKDSQKVHAFVRALRPDF